MNFLTINNRKNFLLGEVPAINPHSRKYLSYWREQKRRCVDGMWSIDDADVDVDISIEKPIFPESNSWRYIPPVCYFYVNFGTIMKNTKGALSKAKVKSLPNLDDVEWEFFYNWMEARGFSGFEFDEEYTCNRMLLDSDYTDEILKERCIDEKGNTIKNMHDNIFNKKKVRKKYIPVRDYIRKLFPKNMGRPIYGNIPKNMMLLGTRGGGKSFLVGGGIIAHEILFDGVREYERGKEKPIAELVVGAAISDKSSDLLKKAKLTVDNLPGAWKKDTLDEIPSAFFKHMSGSLGANKNWTHKYDKKVGGGWKTIEGSFVKHRVFTTENPEAAAGGRPGTIVVEEVGLMGNVIHVHGGNAAAQDNDGEKFGSAIYIGCVCEGTKVFVKNGELKNVEDLNESDLIAGYEESLDVNLLQEIKHLKAKEKKECLKITTNTGREIDCSLDHPIYSKKRNKDITAHLDNLWNYIEAQGLEIGDGIAVANGLDYWGDEKIFDPYLVGMMIGDGTYGIGQMPMLANADSDVWNYIESKYIVKDNVDRSITKDGREFRKARILGIIPELRGLGIYGQTKLNKRLPNSISKCSKKEVCEMIAGYFDADGCVSFNEKSKDGVIKLTSIVKPMLLELQLLFQKMRIQCRIVEEKIHSKSYKGKNAQYDLLIKDRDSVLNFHENINLKIGYKQENLNKFANYKRTRKSKYSTKFTGIRTEKIVSMKYLGSKYVYNLTASGSHSYFANGIETHNTAGNIDKIIESELIFNSPEGFDMLEFDNIWEPEQVTKIAWFIPATHMARRFKDNNGNTKAKEAADHFEKKRQKAARAATRKALETEMMNYPLVPSEMFVNAEDNKFPVKDLKHQWSRLMGNKKELSISYKVEFIIKEDNSIDFKNVKREPIREYPLKNTDKANIDGCPEIFIMPTRDQLGNVPSNIYIAGHDPIDDDDNSDVTRSLQSFWIMNSLTGELVFEYTGRTSSVSDFYEQCRRALIFYNARCNYENNKKGFHGHMVNKSSTYLLVETPEILMQKGMQKSTGVGNKALGTSMSSTDIIVYGLDLLEEWLKTPIEKGSNKMMLHTIKSPALLRELMSFKPGGNFDRISALLVLLILREDKRRVVKKVKDKISSALDDDFFKDTWSEPNNHYLY